MVERERATGSDTSGRGQPKRTALLQGADTGPCCRADPPTHTHTHTPTSALTKRWQRRARLTKSPPQDEHAYRAHAHHEHGGRLAAAGRRKLLASARGRSRASENGQELAGGGKAACLRTNLP